MSASTTKKMATWNSDTVYALGLYRMIAWILGIWPPNYQDLFAKCMVSIVALLQFTMAVSLMGEVKLNCSEANDVVEVTCMIVCAFVCLMKIILLRVSCPKMFDIIAGASDDWNSIETPRAREIMMTNAKIGRAVCLFQLGFGYVTTIPIIFLPFLAPAVNVTGTNVTDIAPRGLPLRTVCVFGNVSDVLYPFVYVLQGFQTFTACHTNLGTDVYFFGITMHLCGQFQILCENLEKIVIFDDDGKSTRNNVVRLVKRHVELLRLSKNLDDTFTFILLFQVSANVLLICFTGLAIIMSLRIGDTVTFVNSLIVIYLYNLQIFWYSYAGDRLTSQIEKIRISVYNNRWYEMPTDIAKDLSFITVRTQKPFNLTAGTIYRMDIDNFKNILKALGSYFSVLQMMFDE